MIYRLNALRLVDPEEFDIQFRRQGWLRFEYVRPEHVDPHRLSQRWHHSETQSYSPYAFHDRFGDNTFRKLLGYIYTHSPCTRDDLLRLCSNGAVLDEHLAFMQDQELAEGEAGAWRKAGRFAHVDNIGRTLEWWVAEWFQLVLKAPARYGVRVEDLAEGGDLDVVAFVNDLRVWVECKSGRDTPDEQLRLFLQRAQEFAPDIAILLIDSEGSIGRYVEALNNMRGEMGALSPQDSHGSLYWGMRNVYLVNTRKSIADSLASVLRLYYSKVKHLNFWSQAR